LFPAASVITGGDFTPHETFKPVKTVTASVLTAQTTLAVAYIAPVYVAPVSSYSGTGDSSLDWIIAHESGGNAYAVNPHSGACGIAQELPCGKSGCTLGDAQCEINWMRNYCIVRYGSTYNAMLYWQAHGNY